MRVQAQKHVLTLVRALPSVHSRIVSNTVILMRHVRASCRCCVLRETHRDVKMVWTVSCFPHVYDSIKQFT